MLHAASAADRAQAAGPTPPSCAAARVATTLGPGCRVGRAAGGLGWRSQVTVANKLGTCGDGLPARAWRARGFVFLPRALRSASPKCGAVPED